MRVRLAVEVHTMKLYNGRRSVHASVTFFGWTWWVQRWDTARCPANRFRTGDMGWTWGRR